MAWARSSRELSCLGIYRLLHASVHCRLILYSLSKKLVFMPVTSAMTGAHRDCLVLSCIVQQPEIHYLVSRDQIVSPDPLLTDGWTNIILI